MSRIADRGVVARYHRQRAELIAQLGGACDWCGCTYDLQFHHRATRTWIARKKSRWCRLVLYRREAAQGDIVLLCANCNSWQGDNYD